MDCKERGGDCKEHPEEPSGSESELKDGLVLVKVDEDIAAAPIANALFSTGRFTTEECSDLAEGILVFIDDHDLVVAKKN